jgi:hypothetical protein
VVIVNLIINYAIVLLSLKYPKEINDKKYKYDCFDVLNMMVDELVDKNINIFL